MNCHDALGQLNTFLDHEVATKESLAIEQHLHQCPACTAQFARERAWREGLRAKADYHIAPESLRRRVQAAAAQTPERVGEQRRNRTLSLTWLQLGGALAAVALLTWTGTVLMLRPPTEELTAEEMVAAHVQASLGHRLTEVDSSDQHTVKPWLSARLDYSPPVRDFSSDGLPLAGGRIARMQGRDRATLVYRYGNHVIDVFVVPEHASAPPTLFAVRGFNVATKSGRGMRWSAVSDVSPEVLDRLIMKLVAPPPQ
jgi:anti-sigma factor (TIGR02949 family)